MEYIKFAFSGVNIISSVMLLLIFFYWIMTIVGIFSVDSFDLDIGVDLDFDLDFDVDIDLDIEMDVEMEMEMDSGDFDADTGDGIDGGAHGSTFMMKILKFSNLGDVPFMIYMTIFTLNLWSLNMLTYYLGTKPNTIIGVGLFVNNLIVSFFLTKIVTNPMRVFFKSMEDSNSVKVLGKTCELKSDVEPGELAQGQVISQKYPMIVNVTSLKSNLKKGEKVVIVKSDELKNLYTVDKMRKKYKKKSNKTK